MKAEREDSGMLTTTEVARLLHVHPNTVRQWANRGLIYAYRLGLRGDRRFTREALQEFLHQRNQRRRDQVPKTR